jgi:hypothetical protein
MPPPHLLLEPARDRLGPELAPLFRDDDLEGDVEQQVAELLAHRAGVVVADGLVELERLFDEVRAQRLRGLRGVPRTPRPEVAHEYHGTSKR